jgi:hypothetical protein
MKDIIKRILTEGVELQLDKVITILLKKYPNPMEDLMGGVKYLKELGFDDKEVSEVFRYYLKGMFANHPTLNIYYQVFDSIFRIDDLKAEFEVVYDDDEYGDEIETEDQNHMIFNLWDVNDEYGDPTQVMNWYDVGYYLSTNIKAPNLDIDGDYLNLLQSLFGSKWKEPFKRWFEMRFDLRVKTIG